MQRILTIAIVVLTYQWLQAQDYAGPDTTICSGSEVMIGIPSSNSTYCYYWDAAEGMPEDQRHLAQPTVSPEHNTVFRVTVRGPMFQEIGSDQVHVFVDFGPVVTTPSYINIGMTDSIQATAELLKDGGRPFTWLVVDQDDTGCFINTFSGEVTDCTSSGKFKFKAQAINDLSCDVDGKLDVNLGVKEVIATDAKNPLRKAYATKGETLRVVNAFDSGVGNEVRTINLKAIPNKGGIFGPDTPDWISDLDGEIVANDLYIGDVSDYGTKFAEAADDRTIQISYEDADVEISTTEANLDFIENALDYIFLNLVDNSCPAGEGKGGYILPSLTISITEEKKRVEKYASPDLADAYKYTFAPAGIGVCGEVAVPVIPPYKVPKFDFGLQGFISATGVITISVDAIYDPSKENPYGGGVTLVGSLDLNAGLKFPVEVPSAGFEASAFLTSGAKATIQLDYPKVSLGFEVGGLTGTIKGTAFYGVMSNSYSVSTTANFLPSKKFAPIPLFTLKN